MKSIDNGRARCYTLDKYIYKRGVQRVTNLQKLAGLKKMVFAQSNEHCFIEKERYLGGIDPSEDKLYNYYPRLLAGLLSRVSTPVDEKDIFVGRVVEAMPDAGMQAPNRLLMSKGHLIPDYEKLLKVGYRGVLQEIKGYAENLRTESAYHYVENATIVIDAIHQFALRYAEAAKAAGNERAYRALLRVPYEPAYDLYSALQCVWLHHMIASCYVGYRDYGFGYMDEYLYPYYLQEKQKGTSDEEITETLAGFMIKTNEICGRAPHNYNQKPVLCQASKQYLLLDGGRANELSKCILRAARLNCMAQPELTVILSEDAAPDFRTEVFEAMAVLTDKLQVYNFDLLQGFLKNKGLPDEICARPAFTACCTGDIHLQSCREEYYMNCVQIFCKVLFENSFTSKEELLTAFSAAITADAEEYIEQTRFSRLISRSRDYVLDCLLLGNCNEVCDYPPTALKYRAKNIFLVGLATLGDSLAALEQLVFRGDVPYDEFVAALQKDFEGEEAILKKIAALPKFGNDTEADAYTVEMAETLLSAVEAAQHTENEYLFPSFYSLSRENDWAHETPATPDGKRAGVAVSENQSPTYGADRSGITAMLNSLSKIPFARTAAGGLNLTFSSAVEPKVLEALVRTYFHQGGLHIGITVLDREALSDAMEHPEKYPTLTVRLYGFSEYFISLPRWQQQAVLNRTAY